MNQTFVFFAARDERIASVIQHATPHALRLSWTQLWPKLRHPWSVRAVIVSSCAVDDGALIRLERANARDRLPPLIAACLRFTPEDVRRTWQLAPFAFCLVTTGEEVERRLKQCLEGAKKEHIHRRLNAQLHSESPVAKKVIAALVDKHHASPAEVANSLGISRASLYRELRTAGLPPYARVATLFKLGGAVESLRQGATIDQAATVAGYSTGRGLRRVLDRMGLSVGEVRRGHDLFEAWWRWTAASAGRGS